MKCHKCGHINPGKFCNACGAKEKNLKWWQILLIIIGSFFTIQIIVSIIILFAGAFLSVSKATINATPTPLETREEYISSCQTVNFSELVRNPSNYTEKRVAVTGEISQFLSGGSFTEEAFVLFEDYEYDKQDTYLTQRWYILYVQPISDRIIVGDIVVFYGEFEKVMKTNTILGATMEAPRLIGKYHVIQKAKG